MKSLKEIEKRLLEIEEERPRRLHNLKENYSNSLNDEIAGINISYLDVEKARLQMERRFALDKRNNWLARIIWSGVVPIIVAVITAYLVTILIGK